MFECHDCHCKAFHVEAIEEVFCVNGRFCLVEKVPAVVCDRCGEELFSSETSEHIRVMLHGADKPLRSVSLDVFSYQEAV